MVSPVFSEVNVHADPHGEPKLAGEPGGENIIADFGSVVNESNVKFVLSFPCCFQGVLLLTHHAGVAAVFAHQRRMRPLLY